VWLLLLLLVAGPLLSVVFLANQRQVAADEAITAAGQVQRSFSDATQLEQLGLWLTIADVTERINAALAEGRR